MRPAPDGLPYHTRRLLTPTEQAFAAVLHRACDPHWVMLVKVRLGCLVWVSVRSPEYQAARNQVQRKHVDFVGCHRETLQPAWVVELDDPSHDRPERQERDRLVDAILAAADLPIVHVRTQPVYDRAALAQAINTALAQPRLAPSPAPSPYRPVRHFVPPAWVPLYHDLAQAVGRELAISTQVRLADVIHLALPETHSRPLQGRLRGRELPFVLADPATWEPVAVIWPGGASAHRHPAPWEETALAQAGLPLLRLDPQWGTSPARLAQMIQRARTTETRGPAAEPSPAPAAPPFGPRAGTLPTGQARAGPSPHPVPTAAPPPRRRPGPVRRADRREGLALRILVGVITVILLLGTVASLFSAGSGMPGGDRPGVGATATRGPKAALQSTGTATPGANRPGGVATAPRVPPPGPTVTPSSSPAEQQYAAAIRGLTGRYGQAPTMWTLGFTPGGAGPAWEQAVTDATDLADQIATAVEALDAPPRLEAAEAGYKRMARDYHNGAALMRAGVQAGDRTQQEAARAAMLAGQREQQAADTLLATLVGSPPSER